MLRVRIRHDGSARDGGLRAVRGRKNAHADAHEPYGLRQPRSGGIPHRGCDGQLSGGGCRVRRQETLRRSVPSRSGTHARRQEDHTQFPVQSVRREGRLYHGRLHRERGAAHTRTGGRTRDRAGTVRRRGLRGGGGTHRARRARPAHLHIRRSRHDAQERARGDRGGVRRQIPAPGVRGREGQVPFKARRRDRAGTETKDHRRGVRPRVREREREIR